MKSSAFGTWGATSRDALTELQPRYVTPESEPDGATCRLIFIPNDPQFVAAVNELLSRLGFVEVWEQSEDGITPEAAAALGAQMYTDFTESDCDGA